MPWGWECRSHLVKQVQTKPTEPRVTGREDFQLPGPSHYEPPKIYCGNGFSHIRRAPAYTMGPRTPIIECKPAAKPTALVYNIRNLGHKGIHRVPNGVIGEQLDIIGDRTKKPGPNKYAPKLFVKRPPEYSMRIAAKPPYQPWDMWTPPPNMYCPPIPCKHEPSYSLYGPPRELTPQDIPGPGQYDPKFNYVKKTRPAPSFGYPFRPLQQIKSPAPNEYCIKKYVFAKPGRSFGIRHTPYLGKTAEYLKTSKLDLLAQDLTQ